MKKTLNGMTAYSKMRTADLPEKTDTYTPIPHADVIMKVKEQIIKSGFIISGENYNCTGDGKIGVGSFGIVFESDPDITLGLNFLNSYNKTYAFRLSMGGQIKGTNIPFQLNDSQMGHFKRLHTGAADLLSSDKISEMIKTADQIWKLLYAQKEFLKQNKIDRNVALTMLMDLFMEDKLTTFQLNFVKKEVKTLLPKDKSGIPAWEFYKTLLVGISEAHPTTWINDMVHCHGEILSASGYNQAFPTISFPGVEPLESDDDLIQFINQEGELVKIDENGKLIVIDQEAGMTQEEFDEEEANFAPLTPDELKETLTNLMDGKEEDESDLDNWVELDIIDVNDAGVSENIWVSPKLYDFIKDSSDPEEGDQFAQYSDEFVNTLRDFRELEGSLEDIFRKKEDQTRFENIILLEDQFETDDYVDSSEGKIATEHDLPF